MTFFLLFFLSDTLLPGWSHHQLPSVLKHALHTLSFNTPTPVQDATLPISLASPTSSSTPGRDLVAIAETGSGKTLAYALPILNTLFNLSSVPPPDIKEDLPISALILTPTRELCLQVKAHIDSVLVAMCTVTDTATNEKPKNRSGVSTVAICGGIAVAKQRKQLERSKRLFESEHGGRGSILVATPGRLWDLIQSWDALANGIRRRLDWLVVDEADKMIEKGHFEEVDKILKLIKRPAPLDGQDGTWKDDWGKEEKVQVKESIRTMVFSATMDKHLQINLKKNWRQTRTQRDKDRSSKDPLEDLLERIDFRDEEPELIDLSPKGRVAGGLKECKIECVLKDKDLYLFHFLLRYSGRTLVFLSSISALRRLAPILTLLFPHSTVLTLHSGMQQRARLKSLDKFRLTSKTILLSTDVAARGLDIPLVNHVIHYQIPRTVDCYVHRSGRTARAGRDGVALVLVGPDELKVWRGLMRSLNRVDNLPSPPIEHSISGKLQELLVLAKKIDELEHRSSKQAHESNWTKKTAEILDIDEDGGQYE
ncbi:hypothetical protein CROQUDRAFT_35798 [Cronartium quercuum f. sp. fusiforme G11]|uniref:ATP-dependent RNA helicase n=1 Tax=Cronartium quercuum f. sp. fusiforme G11 TaxID=708437 RepID=A0A9P6NXF6_9BASI|nr:hypothetical protein CROQUDRAFT_35798 [Cronartium quercuum f. sp. fusiforme G11]